MRKPLLGFGVALVALTAMASPAAAATFKCNETVTGGTFNNVAVPANGSCTLIDSTVSGDVSVTTNGYFEASNTDISGKVRANNAQTLFIDNDTTVGRDIKSGRTAQVFIYDSTVGRGIAADDGTEVVQICGNLVAAGGIHVTDSGPDILVGDPLADCGGNTVTGDIEVSRNFVDVELVVRGNTVSDKNLEVIKNLGPADKIVEGNTGGKQVNCRTNDAPFTAVDNNGWAKGRTGQCHVLLTCEEELTGADVDEAIVPAGAACTLIDSKVTGNATALDNAYLQATNTAIGGKVRATRSQTLFLDSQSTVGGDVKAERTIQVYVFNATIGRGISVNRTTEVLQLCGTTVTKGNVLVTDSGTDILVGLPSADCFGNTVSQGNMTLERNFADVEFEVNGNSIPLGNLKVRRNKGPVEKSVRDNTGGNLLECVGNELPFAAAGNVFTTATDQCIEV